MKTRACWIKVGPDLMTGIPLRREKSERGDKRTQGGGQATTEAEAEGMQL